jgi:hypothetical protein
MPTIFTTPEDIELALVRQGPGAHSVVIVLFGTGPRLDHVIAYRQCVYDGKNVLGIGRQGGISTITLSVIRLIVSFETDAP